MNGAESFRRLLESMPGVAEARLLDGDAVTVASDTEASVTVASGGMPLDNRGMDECLRREHVFVMHCDASFPRPDTVTMMMVDGNGTVVGHDVPPAMREEFGDMPGVVHVADGFVIHSDRMGCSPVTMVMLESRLEVPGAPDGTDCVMFYPSMPTADALNRLLGFEGEGMATVVVGVDLPDDGKLSSCDRCGAGSRSTGRPLSASL